MSIQSDFDFDLMVRLANEDPFEFVRKRDQLIRLVMEASACPDKCYRLQAEIDFERFSVPQGEKTYVAMAAKLNALVGEMTMLVRKLACKD